MARVNTINQSSLLADIKNAIATSNAARMQYELQLGAPVAVTGGPTREQILSDTEGLTNAAFRDLNNGQLADIRQASEGAGASANALSALLGQEATAATAGNVAKIRTDALLKGEEINAQLQGILQQGLAQKAVSAQSSSTNELDALIKVLTDFTTRRNQDILKAQGQADIQVRFADINAANSRNSYNNATALARQQIDSDTQIQNNVRTNNTNLAIAKIQTPTRAPNPFLRPRR